MDLLYPGWNPTKTSHVHVITTSPTVNLSDGHHLTTGWERLPTLMPDGMVPVYVKDMPTTNANAAGGLPGAGASAHSGFGVGTLGMFTMMIMLYNLLSGLGFGFMLWKGLIDWKGNVNIRGPDNTDTTFTDATPINAAPVDDASADDTSSDNGSIAETRSILRELISISQQMTDERMNGPDADLYANDPKMQSLPRQRAQIEAQSDVSPFPSS